MNDIPQYGWTYAALGASVLALSGFLVWSLVKRAVARSDTEGTLDQRAAILVQTLQSAYEKIGDDQRETVKDERARSDKLQEELFKSYQRFGDAQVQMQATITQEVNKVREESREAAQRLHARLDETEAKHETCQAQLTANTAQLATVIQWIKPTIPPTTPGVSA